MEIPPTINNNEPKSGDMYEKKYNTWHKSDPGFYKYLSIVATDNGESLLDTFEYSILNNDVLQTYIIKDDEAHLAENINTNYYEPVAISINGRI